MKLLSPKRILLFLIIIFLTVNLSFLYQYMFNVEAIDYNHTYFHQNEEGFLKKYIDFNSTTFEYKGILYFNYRKVIHKNLIHDNEQSQDYNYNISNSNNSYNINTSFCDYYFSDRFEDTLFIDSNLNTCKGGNFDINSKCCSQNETVDIFSSNFDKFKCDYKTKCCSSEYMCVYKCLTQNDNENEMENDSTTFIPLTHTIFKECSKTCKIKPITKTYSFPYCYHNSKDLINWNLTLVISKYYINHK